MNQNHKPNINNTAVLVVFLAANSLSVRAETVDPKIEVVRQDLGYYEETKDAKTLAKQLQSLSEEIRQVMKQQNDRLQKIEDELKQLNEKISALTPVVSAPAISATSPPKPDAASAPASVPVKINNDTLTVCAKGCDFQRLQQAVNAAPVGGTIILAAEINGSCAVINKAVTIRGQRLEDGTRSHLVGGVCDGKGPLVTKAKGIVIENLEISGIQVGDGNGACIRMDPETSDLTIRNIHCHDSQMGILGKSNGRFLMEDSLIEKTVASRSYSHAIYLSAGDEGIIRRCKILNANNAGHTLKTGFQKLTVEDSVLAALNSRNSRAVDAFGGGDITLRRNVIQQGPESDNSDVIGFGLEAGRLLPRGHSLLVEDNWIIYDDPGRWHKILIRGQKLGAFVVRNNAFVGMNGLGDDSIKDEGNQWFDTREKAGLPEYDGTFGSLPNPGESPIATVTPGKTKRKGWLF